MLPIIYEGAVDFLDSEYFSGQDFMPYTITQNDKERIPNRLWESADYKKKIFGFTNVAKYNANAFFFQLVATGILTFNWVNANKTVIYRFGKNINNVIKYKAPL